MRTGGRSDEKNRKEDETENDKREKVEGTGK
jgi:hypothetical protein